MLEKIFLQFRVAPLTERVPSRNATIYLDRGMKLHGWIAPENKYLFPVYVVWCVILNTIIMAALPLMFGMSYITELKGFTPAQFLTSLQAGINLFGCPIKAAITFAGVKRFNKAKKLLDQMDERCVSDEERMLVHRGVSRCNKIYMCYQILDSSYVTSTFLVNVILSRLPWKLYNPLINGVDGKGKFWIAAIIEYLLMLGGVMQDQLADCYPTIYMSILRTHVHVLIHRIRRLRIDKKLSHEQDYHDLIACINYHKLILQYCDHFRPIISGTIFVQFLLIGIVIGLSLINILFFSTGWTAIPHIVLIIAFLGETFPFCYVCNMLMDDCRDMADAIFQSNWHGADRRYTKSLLFFLHNAQQPIIYTAGGIFIVCMNTNISVAKLAFSVVTFVKQMNIVEKFLE